MRILNRLRTDDSGAVLVWVAGLAVVLLALGALAIDAGYGYAVKRNLSSAADAASLAGAQAAALEYAANPSWSGCTPTYANAVAPKAQAAANDSIAKNVPTGVTGSTVTVTCNGNAIDVAVDLDKTVSTYIMKVIPGGAKTITPKSSATAEVSGSPTYGGLRPFAVCSADIPTGAVPGTTYQTVFPQAPSKPGVCGAASGQFGILDYNGGSNPTGDIQNWTRYGYPFDPSDPPVSIPGPIDGDPGGPGTYIKDDLDYLIDNNVTFLLPVFDGWTGGGNGAEVHSNGVVSVELCGYSLDPSMAADKTDPSCWDAAKYATADPKSKFVFQWRYVAYSSSYLSGGKGTACTLGPNCVPTIRLVK